MINFAIQQLSKFHDSTMQKTPIVINFLKISHHNVMLNVIFESYKWQNFYVRWKFCHPTHHGQSINPLSCSY